jgi:glyoxylase-like metal-dependent hydrolase (beta-lactamase superfamily II)
MKKTIVTRRTVLTGVVSLVMIGGAPPTVGAADNQLKTITDGEFDLPGSAMGGGPRADEATKALAAAGWPTDRSTNVLNVTLLERPEGYALFDCGAGPNFVPGVGQLIENLAAAGVAPEAVTDVFFTHAHPDHLWGAIDDFDEPMFKSARYHISAAEYDNWFDPGIYAKLPEDRHAFAAGAQRVLKHLEPVLTRFKPETDVAPGIHAVATPGHTPGHVAFEIKTGGQTALIGGDFATHGLLSFQHPDWPGRFDQDGDQAIATRLKMLDKLATERTTLVGYHLPKGGIGRVERAGSAYRFIPNGA